jgi:hypothetical protein
MAVTVSCPACGQSLPLSEELLGKKIRCKSCQEVFVAQAAKAKVGARGAAPAEAPAKSGRNGTTTAPTPRRPAGRPRPRAATRRH